MEQLNILTAPKRRHGSNWIKRKRIPATRQIRTFFIALSTKLPYITCRKRTMDRSCKRAFFRPTRSWRSHPDRRRRDGLSLESVHFLGLLFMNLRQNTQQSINDLYISGAVFAVSADNGVLFQTPRKCRSSWGVRSMLMTSRKETTSTLSVALPPTPTGGNSLGCIT